MKLLPFGSIVFLIFFSFCTSNPDLTPEATVQLWQSYIDKNKFDLARQLSTDEALTYVNELASYNVGTDTLEWENNVMLDLRCQIIGDSAICFYQFEDEVGGAIPGQLALKRIKGRWFVSRTDFEYEMPYDTLHPGDEELIFPSDSLEEELE
jgi:hypothetical protein